jgi:putative membrane protein
MNRYLLLATPLALAVSAPAMAQVMTPREYVAAAGASDLFERQSSAVVLETTTDPKVREFAMMMQTAHSQSTADVKAAAKASKLKPAAPMLTPLQTEMIAQLKAETGTARDAAYLAQQKAAHGKALSVQQAYAQAGTAPALKAAAGKIVPVVRHHIGMLMQM